MEKKNILVHIITASAALFFMTSVISAAFCIRHRIRQKKFKASDLEFISMRDQFRQRSTDGNPSLELLADLKQVDLVQYSLVCVEFIRDLRQGQFGKVFHGMQILSG